MNNFVPLDFVSDLIQNHCTTLSNSKKIIMKKSLCTLCMVLVSIFVTYADKTIYVSPTGTGDGTTPATACRLNQIFGKLPPAVSLDATGTTTLSFDASAAYSITTNGTSDASKACVLVPDAITKKIIFEGNNATFNAGSTGSAGVRMLRIGSSTNVELRNLTFNNGTHTGSSGGAVYFAGDSLKISGCTFNNCSADNGGAVASRGKYVKIVTSWFKNNYLLNNYYGGALTHTGTTLGGTLIIENTTFSNNAGKASTACYGTAVCTAYDGGSRGYLNTISISNCTFYKNLESLNTTAGNAAVHLDELSSGTTNAVFVNNTFYGNSDCALYIKGIKQTVTFVNNVIAGSSWASVSGSSIQDHGIITEKNSTTDLRPTIIGKNNYIVAKNPVGINITESSFQSGSNGNTFVTTTAQSVIDSLYLNTGLSATSVPYLTITGSTSPLVNTGTSSVSGITIPSMDITGFQRTPNYTIGAYQATLNVASGTIQTVNQNVSLLSTTIQPTGKLTLTANRTLTTGSLTVQSDASGTGTYVDNGTTTVTGIANVQQYLTAGRNWYITSPVSNATTAGLSSTSSILYYDEPTAQWLSPIVDSQLMTGRGYISTATTSTGVISFAGSLNTGTVSIPLTRTTGLSKEGFNLVGNPYSSYLDWSKVDTISAQILSTIWYRTQTTGNSYTFDTYNGQGNVSTSLGATPVTNLIPPMQAFWVRVKQGVTSGTLTFNNSMRSHGDYSTNTFKAPAIKSQYQPLLRLEISNAVNRDEALIYFNENASNGYDAYDSPKMTNGNAATPEIYTNAESEKLVINGMKSLHSDLELPLGFTPGYANTFSIKASEVTNLNGVDILLKDQLLNTEFNLKNGEAYTFTSDSIPTNKRFAVLFEISSITTGLEAVSASVNVQIHSGNGQIIIINGNESENIIPGTIYNSVGQQVANLYIAKPQTIVKGHFPTGIYVIRIKTKTGINTQKFIVN